MWEWEQSKIGELWYISDAQFAGDYLIKRKKSYPSAFILFWRMVEDSEIRDETYSVDNMLFLFITRAICYKY